MAVETRPWIGRSMKRREDPALLSGSATFTNDYARARACCTPRCCAARTPTPRSARSTATARVRSTASSPCSAAPSWPRSSTRCRASAPRRSSSTPSPSTRSATPVRRWRSRSPSRATWPRTRSSWSRSTTSCSSRSWTRSRPRRPGAPLLHENLGTNVVYEKTFTHGDVEGDFARAAHVIRRTLALAARRARRRWSPRARSASSTAATGRMDVHSNSNMLNFAAWVLSGHAEDGAGADRLPPDVHGRELRLQAPDGEGDRAGRLDVEAHRAPGEVHGGPRRQPAGQRLAGARPPLRGRARARRRRPVPVAAHRRRRRLRRVLPVRRRRQHATRWPRPPGRTRSARARTRSRPC